MAKPLSLRLIYTSNLRGDISSLPRLFTFIQRHLRALGPGALLLDLGNCCADEAWHCRATGGRSMLIALDGMGYHAANVTDALDARERLKLARGVTMALVDQDHAWRYHVPPRSDPSLVVTARPCKSDARLQIDMRPADRMRIAGNVLFLRDVRAGQIGSVSVDLLRRRESGPPACGTCRRARRRIPASPPRSNSSRMKLGCFKGNNPRAPEVMG